MFVRVLTFLKLAFHVGDTCSVGFLVLVSCFTPFYVVLSSPLFYILCVLVHVDFSVQKPFLIEKSGNVLRLTS